MTPHATTNWERRRPWWLARPFSPPSLLSTQAGQNRKNLGRLVPVPVAVYANAQFAFDIAANLTVHEGGKYHVYGLLTVGFLHGGGY